MSTGHSSWLTEFAAAARRTDRFVGSVDHTALLSAGLLGEAGSMIAELKKEKREREAYPAYRHRMREEIGDVLWYFVRLADVLVPDLLPTIQLAEIPAVRAAGASLTPFLQFGAVVGALLNTIATGRTEPAEIRTQFGHAWSLLQTVGHEAGVSLSEAAAQNTRKIVSRWPSEKVYQTLFDGDFPEEEQLPRRLDIEFRECPQGSTEAVILRCNGINFGDRLTDNIEDPDGYRYHDIFHFSHAVHLGWSPVIRALLRCKRKSCAKKDEGQDGARALILEEAAAAVVFSRAKQLRFFEGIDHVDYDLLKTISEIVQGFEVESVPLWQWEAAILNGYSVFRSLRRHRGGKVTIDLEQRKLCYLPPA